jgi:putative transposase
MIVRYDPRDLSRIYLLGPDGNYYDLSYRDIRRAPISHWEHRRAVKRLREEGYSAVDEGAIFRTVERMRAVTDAASAATKGIRRERERRLRVASGNVHPALSAVAPATEVSVSEGSSELYPVEEW